jgi:DNA-binding CsgD family transcriptional regulator
LLCCLKGELAAAALLVEEADVIAEATRTPRIGFGRVLLAAYTGEEKPGLAQIEACEAAAAERNEGVVLTFGEHARAVLYNGLGRYPAALGPARSASARDELMVSSWALAELVEAAARCGENDIASDAMERLSARTQAAGSDLALGIEARGRALVSEGARIEEFHREAVDRLGRSRLALELARSHLLYGEWLRRENRRIDARQQLRTAHEMFTSMRATAFADRASRELLATGETVHARTPDLRDELTPQEAQIAALARDGLTNPEIGARMFLSPRTVQYHLHKVFTKLDLKSRHELENALPGNLAD